MSPTTSWTVAGRLARTDGAGWWCVEDTAPCRRCRRSPVTGLSREVLAELVAELGPRWQARQDARLADRPRRRAVGAGARCRLVFVDRLLATLVHLRHGVTHDVLACWFGVSRSTLVDTIAHLGASRTRDLPSPARSGQARSGRRRRAW
ncbi:helix-turn-helix domain-containing protein [Geodermatophilus bullaregiensis]|uniref:helix-turn-helix domain-containing protein n=1 Tax=Geodermatophilus bullaregiensis TaxID=1564160 RepID=UPI0027DDC79E|nr:transposase family protein [Geodermatophilus bullaregiensis]